MNVAAAIDRASPVRPGEEFATAALEAFLLAHLPGSQGPLTVEQFPRGFSNLTYLLRLGEQELVLRRPPRGAQIKSAHDMRREFRILQGLLPVYPKVPRALVYGDDLRVMGAPFYVMERVRGVILRDRIPPELDLTPARMGQISEAAVDTLVALHAVDFRSGGLADLGRPDGYVARQVSGWAQRYANAATDDLPDMVRVAAWLSENQPARAAGALIHNDFKYDNLVLDPQDLTRVVAVLDWEMATIGDPLMDLGTTLAYWMEANDPPALRMLGLTGQPGNLTRRQVVERYAQGSGRDVDQVVFYYVYGLFKIAVIGQQIYFRFKQGHTRDPRFAGLGEVVADCARLAARAIALNRIDELDDAG